MDQSIFELHIECDLAHIGRLAEECPRQVRIFDLLLKPSFRAEGDRSFQADLFGRFIEPIHALPGEAL